MVSRHITNAIPVAMGTTKHDVADWTPGKSIKFSKTWLGFSDRSSITGK